MDKKTYSNTSIIGGDIVWPVFLVRVPLIQFQLDTQLSYGQNWMVGQGKRTFPGERTYNRSQTRTNDDIQTNKSITRKMLPFGVW